MTSAGAPAAAVVSTFSEKLPGMPSSSILMGVPLAFQRSTTCLTPEFTRPGSVMYERVAGWRDAAEPVGLVAAGPPHAASAVPPDAAMAATIQRRVFPTFRRFIGQPSLRPTGTDLHE